METKDAHGGPALHSERRRWEGLGARPLHGRRPRRTPTAALGSLSMGRGERLRIAARLPCSTKMEGRRTAPIMGASEALGRGAPFTVSNLRAMGETEPRPHGSPPPMMEAAPFHDEGRPPHEVDRPETEPTEPLGTPSPIPNAPRWEGLGGRSHHGTPTPSLHESARLRLPTGTKIRKLIWPRVFPSETHLTH